MSLAPGRGVPPDKKHEVAVIARAARGGVISVDTAARALGVPRRTASERLAALVRSGWLTRIRRGLYHVLPLESASKDETTVEDPWVLAAALFSPCYICGWSAAEHWGMTEQLFRSTLVATTAHIRGRSVTHMGAFFTLVRVKPARLEHLSLVWRGSTRVRVSSRERTIVDAAIDPRWLGGFRQLAEVVANYSVDPKADPIELLGELQRAGTGAAAKRIGFLTERLWPSAEALIDGALEARSAGVIKLDPAIPRRGRINSRWRLWVNTTVDAHTPHE